MKKYLILTLATVLTASIAFVFPFAQSANSSGKGERAKAVGKFAPSAPIGLTQANVPYEQNFDSLATSGTTNVLTIPGWEILEMPSGDGLYRAGTGAGSTADTYSFGYTADRALGGLRNGTLIPTFGASFVNNTGESITTLDIAYTGEQWRLGTAARADRIEFGYSMDASSLSTGTWTQVPGLYFTSPNTTAEGSIDGTLPANRLRKTARLAGLSIPNGGTFYIRWTDFDASGADDGLAVDDFSITAVATPALTINNASSSEGQSGTKNLAFAVVLSKPAPPGGVTFDIATADGTAQDGSTAGEDADYVGRTLAAQTVPQGATAFSFYVTTNGDIKVESDETFFVNVSNIAGASAVDTQGLGTIFNDDAAPQNLIVTTTDDSVDGVCDSDCGLREAIQAANSNPDRNTITFSVDQTNGAGTSAIEVGGTEISITSDLTITGPGAGQLTIDGGMGNNRIFDIDGADVSITGVTLMGGDGGGVNDDGDGGAIRANGQLMLRGVHLTSNAVGGGSSNNGGALLLEGSGPYSISETTFSGNSADGCGGGLVIRGTADVSITNTTFSGNSSGTGNSGGAVCITGSGTVSIRSATIYANISQGSGGGIYHSGGVLDLGSSIVAGNNAPLSPDIVYASGTIVSSGFNLIGDSAGDSSDTFNAITFAGTDTRDVDPQLAPLGDNGGLVPTHSFDNSVGVGPAVDAGFAFGVNTDARGLTRPINLASVIDAAGSDGSDIGAFEIQAPSAAPVSIAGRIVTAAGRGIGGARVTLTDGAGVLLTATTSSFGYFRFDSVRAGERYAVEVSARRYAFASRFIIADADIADLSFVAER